MNSTSGAAISLQAVCKQYLNDRQAFTAVDRIDLDVEPSSFVALTGPSGSGKSTLLHLIGSIDAPDSGSITIDHIDITALTRRQLPDYRRRVGFVFQRYNLLPALTALDNVLAPVLPIRVDFDKTARARELLAAVGLADRERSLPGRMSGGQQQRIAIARALINHPPLLLADEPTGNLDSHTGTEIVQLLTQLRAETGMTILLATHDPQVAAHADRIVHLLDGQIDDDQLLGRNEPQATQGRVDRMAGN